MVVPSSYTFSLLIKDCTSQPCTSSSTPCQLLFRLVPMSELLTSDWEKRGIFTQWRTDLISMFILDPH
ncbi:hypothetical protein ACFX13_004168 [Malus domestica]